MSRPAGEWSRRTGWNGAVEKVDMLMRFCDLYDETRIVPSTERLVCHHVNGPFSIWPEMGIDRFASPDAPFTFVLPERRNPSLIGDPRASITEGCAWARVKAPL